MNSGDFWCYIAAKKSFAVCTNRLSWLSVGCVCKVAIYHPEPESIKGKLFLNMKKKLILFFV